MQGSRWLAQSLGRKMMFIFKHLHEHDGTMTSMEGRKALLQAPVEFPARASAGFARG
jgi:hypothetical protein